MEHRIADWDAISIDFSKMFHKLGEVIITESHLSYSSVKPHVTTAIMLTRDGQLVASMPLHNVDSKFEQVIFDDSLESIRLVGTSFNYIYTIPKEILKIRDAF